MFEIIAVVLMIFDALAAIYLLKKFIEYANQLNKTLEQISKPAGKIKNIKLDKDALSSVIIAADTAKNLSSDAKVKEKSNKHLAKKLNQNSANKKNVIFAGIAIILVGFAIWFNLDRTIETTDLENEGKAFGASASSGEQCLKQAFSLTNQECGDNENCQRTLTYSFINSCLSSIKEAKKDLQIPCKLKIEDFVKYCTGENKKSLCDDLDLAALKANFCAAQ